MSCRRTRLAVALGLGLTASLPSSAQETTTYSYDALGRLIGSGIAGGPQDGVSKTLGYDPAGNRSSYAVVAPSNTATFSAVAPSAAVNAGAAAVFTVTKSNAITGVSTVQYATQDGTAHSPGDYTGTSGTLTFQPSDTAKSVSVSTVALAGPQSAKQFSLVISNPSGGPTIATASAQANINAVSGSASPPTTVNQSVTIGVCDATSVDVRAGGDSDPGGNYPLTVVSESVSAGGSIIYAGSPSGSTVAVGSQGNIKGNGQIMYTIKNSAGATATGLLAVTVTAGPDCN